MENLRDLLEDQLKDIFSAEKQVAEALPKLAEAAHSEKLTEAFNNHLRETHGQIERLQEIAEILKVKLGGETCQAAKGLIEEGEEMIEEHQSGPTRDAGLIAAAQRLEHYEMAAYGTARDFAKELGHASVAKLLQQTLDEESEANERLTKIAHKGVNKAAAGNGKRSKAKASKLAEKTHRELYEMAQEKDIAGRSDMNKKELMQALS